MRVLHVPYCFFPDPIGGTEVYVGALAGLQRELGCVTAIAAPALAAATYSHAGFPVWRFPISANLNLRDLYGNGDRSAAEAFGRVLDEFRPDIVHLHAMTSAISVRLAEQVVERSIPIVLNYHTPTVSCSRGTLLKWGSEICDGKLDRRTCSACALHAKGLPRPLAALVGALPSAISREFGRLNVTSPFVTALRMPNLIELRISAFHRLMQLADRVIALCDWTRTLLIRNAVPESKIVLCRQGISWAETGVVIEESFPGRLPLRLAFLGRLDATKGVHIIVQALKADSRLPIQLDLFGIRQGKAGNCYAASLEAMIKGDSRIRLLPPLSSGDVIARLREYDATVVPSQWLETGPLVVLESFAAHAPVIGSNLGGIAELVADGIDGLLVHPANSVGAWTDSLQRICSDSGLLPSLRAGIRPPRHARQNALEILPLYQLLASRKGPLLSAGRTRIPPFSTAFVSYNADSEFS